MNPFDTYYNLFTQGVLQVIQSAEDSAIRLGADAVASEHLLLGILDLREGAALACLQSAGITTEAVLAVIPRQSHPAPENGHLPFDTELASLFANAAKEASLRHYPYICVEHLLLALLFEKSGKCAQILSKLTVDLFRLRTDIINRMEKNVAPPSAEEMNAILDEFGTDDEDHLPLDEGIQPQGNDLFISDDMQEEYAANDGPLPDAVNSLFGVENEEESPNRGNMLARFTRNLNELASKGELDPVIGRAREIQRVLQILCRRTKNNALLLGEAGVGKTAIVEGIATEITLGHVPELLKNKRVLMLDVTSLVAGTKYRGQFEERMKRLLEELHQDKNTILFIDEIHTIVNAGNSDNGLDVSNILKPALARGELQCIGATTPKEYHNSIEKDSALERRFQTVDIEAPSKEETLAILQGVAPRYAEHHHVSYSNDILKAAINLSERYLPRRRLPDKVIDILDEAGSYVSLAANGDTALRPVSLEDLYSVISTMSGVPAGQLRQNEGTRLLHLEEELSQKVIGQTEALHSVCRALRRSRAELKESGRPIGSFLFLGPSGVGKTLLAQTLATTFFNSPDALIRLDMSEYSEPISLTRLIGSTPGYVGYNEGGQLTERVKHRPYSVVLFDEIEKAHTDIMDLLLQILEDGKLTDGSGNHVSFSNAIIILTSNAGAPALADGHKPLGFGTSDTSDAEQADSLKKQAKKQFRPELLNRLDEIIVFNRLKDDDLNKIVELEINKVRQCLQAKGSRLELAPGVVELIRKQGDVGEHGARFYRRQVERLLEDALADELLKTSPQGPFTAFGKPSQGDGISFEINVSTGEEK